MAPPLAQANSPLTQINKSEYRPSRQKRKRNSNNAKEQRIDAATVASKLQLKEEKLVFLYSLIALFLKIGLLSLFGTSLVKVGAASIQRLSSQMEISSVLEYEDKKLDNLKERFDNLFTIGGDNRLMEEQDQWISPNTFRVIWR